MELVKASAQLYAAALGYSTLKKVLKAIRTKDLNEDLNTCIHNHFFVSSFLRFCFSFLHSYFYIV